ncbi:MAG: NADH-quinone oxidoreductase subunit M [Thermoanaerobaculales bacterium]|jgi:NADH-quinone oxidoreductase subunit M|nr:NADH-quinone oxidoreductase subunit M [Thermoanaerobaculales bacterium]
MTLVLLILVPLVGGVAAWLGERSRAGGGRRVSLASTLVELVLVLALWVRHWGEAALGAGGPWLEVYQRAWIPELGVGVILAVDGLSLLMVVLTAFIGVMAVLVSWDEIDDRVGPYYACLLWVLAGITGVFLALDLFLFYVFWEVMLVPMYFLIGIWGHGNRIYAAVKFFIYTLVGGLLMLVSIIALALAHASATGTLTFSYVELLGTPMTSSAAMWIMLGFFVAFAVKLPAVPIHNWLPDAHTEAPTAGSLILAALLLKTGAYGLIRFVVPLFPDASAALAPWALWLGALGIGYGAILAFAQTDLKRLVAYTSVSHMGFVLLGVYSWNALSLQGTVMQMICHGISTGSLFMIVGMLYRRIHTRDVTEMGGLWRAAPRLAGVAMVFAMASLGLPGTGNFIGEFLVIFGVFPVDAAVTVIALLGIVAATVYSLRIIQTAFHGAAPTDWRIADLDPREIVMMAPMVIVIVWLGLWPGTVIATFAPALEGLLHLVPSLVIGGF